MTSPRDRSRWIGALAGLIPAGAVATLFAISGSNAEPGAVAASLAWATGIATVAGWIAGPVLGSEPHRLVKSSFAYAIAVIATMAALSVVQGIVYAAASATYLLIPAVAMGFAWSLVAGTVLHLESRRGT